MTEDENQPADVSPTRGTERSSTLAFVHIETLEQIAERLGWSPERLAEARDRELQAKPLNITDRDRARAAVLSRSLERTRRELDTVLASFTN